MRRARIYLGLLPLLLAPETARAAEGHSGTWLGVPVWVWLWLNFFIFWGLLARFLTPPLRKFFQDRRQQIGDSMRLAERQRQEAEELRVSLEGKIEAIRQEISELETRARSEGERERQEIVEQAHAERDRLVQRTRDELARGVEQARNELTRHTAELAARLAEEQLSGELDAASRRRLFEENLERLERTGS